CQQGDIAPFSF
nr:immunoglobulin light chain junction region [Macaca mulatta]MOX26076.1 immunoglobulin light chain junction region [Macaca mulatta]